MARLALLAVATMLGCRGASREATPHGDAPARDPKATTPTPTNAQLTGYPWQRLVVEGNPVEPLALELPEDALRELGVTSHRSYTATSPPIWLLAFEFADQPALFAAEPRVLALFGENRPPYARKTSHTGAWLLVAGFPTDGDVSQELHYARGAFLDSWAGEE
jgi:hypothetical protein